MTIKVGDRIPSVTLTKVTSDGPQQISSDDYFKGRKIALFSVPGAFTPTCSAKHLPSYVENVDELKAKGVDEIACTAVNDAWVMKAWAEQHDALGKITMLADGSAAFTKALGIEIDIPGLGTRARRGLFMIDNGTVTSVEMEQPGKFEVSGVDACLINLKK